MQLLDILDRDVALLQSHYIMDYSLLFAVERNAHFNGIKAPSRATTSTNSEEDVENNQRCKIFIIKLPN